MNERTIFLEALEQPTPDQRDAFLAQACKENTPLRQKIDDLLRAHNDAGSFIEHSPASTATTRMAGQSQSNTDDPTDQIVSSDLHAADAEINLSFLSPSPNPRHLGRLGSYEILEVLGRGAFGIVLRALDPKLNRVVAIKVLLPELATNATSVRRFLKEAQAAAAVSHDHVVTIHAVEDSQPVPFLVMECILGQSLQERINTQGSLPVNEILRIGMQVASGLAAAHKQGLVHRDIKPGNILLENGVQRVKITDFGLARSLDDLAATQTFQVAGTPQYMSPEQAQGTTIDQRSDLFSLGSVLYTMCAGRAAFRADSIMAILKRVCDDSPRPIRESNPEIPDWLCEIVNRLLEKNPADRYQSAAEVAELLGQNLADIQQHPLKSIPSAATTTPKAVPARQARKSWSPTMVVLLVLAVGLGFTETIGVTELTSTVIRLTTGSGTLVIETDDPGVKVTINGEEVEIQGTGVEQLTLKPGQYKVAALKDGSPFSQQLVTITRGGREVVRVTMEGKVDEGRTAISSVPTERQHADESNWGTFINPLQDCRLQRTLRGVSLAVPGSALHDLNPTDDWNNFAAPRMLQTVEGDFIIQVKVLPFVLSQPGTALRKGYSYRAAGLVVWDYGGTLLRHERASAGEIKDGKPHLQSEWFAEGEQVNLSYVPVVDAPIYLQIERHDDSLSLRWSDDGKEWHNCEEVEDLDLSSRLQVGILAINATSTPMEAVFEDLQIQSKEMSRELKTGIEESTDGWHGWPADAPPPAIAPFDATQAKQHQEAWAAYLKVPVEYTNSLGMKFVLIPPGEFIMGSTPAEIEEALQVAGTNTYQQELIRGETPQHKVILTRPIYFGVHEVTQQQYEHVMGKNPSYFSRTGAGKDAIDAIDTTSLPVETASWNDAVEFCAKLSEQEKLRAFHLHASEKVTPQEDTGYLLPTEAQWEFACRAGTTTKYWIGEKDEDLTQAAWFATNSVGRTHSAGELKSNPFGIYDIHGNVWEWVHDWWEPTFRSQLAEQPEIDPVGPPSSENSWRVVKGGTWAHPASSSRASACEVHNPVNRLYSLHHIGFRVVLTVDLSAVNRPPASDPRIGDELEQPASATEPANVNPELSQTPLAGDPDRTAAEWVLSIGSTLHIKEIDQEERSISAVGDLPDGAFVLTGVNVSKNPMVSDVGLAVFKDCEHLRYLVLDRTKVTKNGLAHFTNCKKLQILGVGETQVGNAGLAHFKDCKSLTGLWLYGTLVNDEGLANTIKELPDIKTLHLGYSRVSDAGLAHLKVCKDLTTIDLAGCDVSDLGLEQLADCPKLKTVHVEQTKVTDAGVKQLGAALPRCTIQWDGSVIEP